MYVPKGFVHIILLDPPPSNVFKVNANFAVLRSVATHCHYILLEGHSHYILDEQLFSEKHMVNGSLVKFLIGDISQHSVIDPLLRWDLLQSHSAPSPFSISISGRGEEYIPGSKYAIVARSWFVRLIFSASAKQLAFNSIGAQAAKLNATIRHLGGELFFWRGG